MLVAGEYSQIRPRGNRPRILYELIVCAGYVCGIAGKFLSAQTGWVVYIYILDLMMVLTDVALTLRNRYLDRLADGRMRREHA